MAQLSPDSVEAADRDAEDGINHAGIALLTSWLEDDDPESVAEQQETWAYLRRVLDEGRLSDRKLFP